MMALHNAGPDGPVMGVWHTGHADNLGKGAASHKLQSANLICGLPTTGGLESAPF